ncbi:Phosphoglycolate phosphatase [compost metagenome]
MILFDLDGTLAQTREASWRVFEQVSREFGLGINSADAFYALSEKNLFKAIGEVCGDPELEARVMDHFFTLLRTEYCPPMIPGMPEVVRRLATRYPLAVLSSNAMSAIRRVLEEGGVAECFGHVFSGDVQPDKSESIQAVLSDCSYGLARPGTPAYDERTGAHHGDVIMITDTVGDVREAVRVGCRVVGVSWGMHTPEQLRAAGAEFVAVWPEELLTYLSHTAPNTTGPA